MECVIDNCYKPSRSFGLCSKHYTRQRKHGSTGIVIRAKRLGLENILDTCSVAACENKGRIRRGFCSLHYERWKRHGNATWQPLTTWERYLAGFEVGMIDECWPWVKSIAKNKYGKFSPNHNKTIGAHRYGYEGRFGKIPAGLYVCHKCDNPPCQNPNHWFLGTPKENTQDMMKKGRHNNGSSRYS